MRKIYTYNDNESKGQVDKFINSSNSKVKKKYNFILNYLLDEKNQFKEPYVKHFCIEKYKQFYELRLKVTGLLVRIIFYNIDENIILLHAFVKKDRRDTEQALEFALKLMEKFDDAKIPMEQISEVELN